MPHSFDTLPPPTVQAHARQGARVVVDVHARSEHVFWSDITNDVLNNGGVFVATYHALPLGTTVEIELRVQDGEPMRAEGIVVWQRAHREGSDAAAGVGIAFTALDGELGSLVERFVSEVREPMLFEPAVTSSRREPSRPSLH